MSIQLPEVKLDNPKTLDCAIFERISRRKFWEKEIELEKLSQLFWAAQGMKGFTRTVPSAGATYPLEIYAILKGKGAYHYDNKEHKLDLHTEGAICTELAKAAWNQTFICEPYLTIFICADYSRTKSRYGKRTKRYIYLEVGHCAQNIHLEAVALGLGSVPIGAFQDEIVKDLLKLPDNVEPIYIIPVGYPK